MAERIIKNLVQKSELRNDVKLGSARVRENSRKFSTKKPPEIPQGPCYMLGRVNPTKIVNLVNAYPGTMSQFLSYLGSFQIFLASHCRIRAVH